MAYVKLHEQDRAQILLRVNKHQDTFLTRVCLLTCIRLSKVKLPFQAKFLIYKFLTQANSV
jgi:hypothetical protein